jgi:hypothetical protein
MYQHTVVDGVERAWEVDLSAAADMAAWVGRAPQVLETDLQGMAQYFPHWILAGSDGGRLARCSRCAALCAPTGGALRCVCCGDARRGDGLLWLGHIPTLARPEDEFARRQRALLEAGFAQVEAGGAVYLLVPLTVLYPSEWPNVRPIVRYAARWLKALNLPRSNAAYHLVQNGQACIFAWGQWRAMPVHAVLQQRVVNHIASLLKIAAGQSPGQAFIGRIHRRAWQPEG